MGKKRQYTIEVGPPASPHETAPRRNLKCPEGPVERPIGFKCTTVAEYIAESTKRGYARRAMGWRKLKEIHEETKLVTKVVDGKETEVEKTWLFYELGPYKFITYGQLYEIVKDYARGLLKMGLRPLGADKMHIFASTSHLWMQTFLAAQCQGIPVVTAYDTLGESGLSHSMSETETRAIFTDNALLAKLVKPLESLPNVKYIIHSEKIDPLDKRHGGKIYKDAQDAVDKIKEARPDIEFFTVDEIMELGKVNYDIELHSPSKDDISCIMYTSGSTGYPKGVVMTHANIVAGIGGISVIIPREVVNDNDSVVAYLPLAHILELVVELSCLYWAAPIGYSSVKTLVDTSVRNCQSDLKELKPTVMVTVAAVCESVRKGVLGQVSNLPNFTQKVFWWAYRTKLKLTKWHLPGGDIIGKVFFKKVRQATGGNLRYMLNGGSAVSKDTQIFITNLVCPMLLGYGLTETVANGAIIPPESFNLDRTGVVGEIAGSATVKLVDVEELGYLAKNNQGEVWIKGGSILKEYFKNEKETSSAIENGWFKTGDIGEWTPDGHLKLIDRKKNLVKTQNGEYVALEKLESVYRSSEYVANICVYADQYKTRPVAIIVPNVVTVTKLAIRLGLMKEGDELEELYENRKLKYEILKSMHKTAVAQGLSGIELILGFVFATEEWTPQNGLLTSAQKLQRKAILATVTDRIEELYKSET